MLCYFSKHLQFHITKNCIHLHILCFIDSSIYFVDFPVAVDVVPSALLIISSMAPSSSLHIFLLISFRRFRQKFIHFACSVSAQKFLFTTYVPFFSNFCYLSLVGLTSTEKRILQCVHVVCSVFSSANPTRLYCQSMEKFPI